MKKSLLFIIPLLLLVACSSEKTYTVGEDAFCTGLEETNPDPVFCVDSVNAPINGIVVEYYPNGKMLRKMTIRDGRENGIEREYHENGKLRVETNVVDGRAEGVSKLYDENGKLYMSMNWQDGSVSDIKLYDASGRVTATGTIE